MSTYNSKNTLYSLAISFIFNNAWALSRREHANSIANVAHPWDTHSQYTLQPYPCFNHKVIQPHIWPYISNFTFSELLLLTTWKLKIDFSFHFHFFSVLYIFTFIYCSFSYNTQVINFDSPRGGISLVTEKGKLTTSRLLVQKAIQSDSGLYTCAPSNANPITVSIHVLNGKFFDFFSHVFLVYIYVYVLKDKKNKRFPVYMLSFHTEAVW